MCGQWRWMSFFIVLGFVVNAKGKGNVRQKLGLSDTYSDQSGVCFLFTDVCLTIEMWFLLLAGLLFIRVVFANNRDYQCANILAYYLLITLQSRQTLTYYLVPLWVFFWGKGGFIMFWERSVLVYNISAVPIATTLYLTSLPTCFLFIHCWICRIHNPILWRIFSEPHSLLFGKIFKTGISIVFLCKCSSKRSVCTWLMVRLLAIQKIKPKVTFGKLWKLPIREYYGNVPGTLVCGYRKQYWITSYGGHFLSVVT